MSISATFKRFFTPQEANGLLPEVRNLVSRIRTLVHEVRRADLILEIAESDELRSDAFCQLEEHKIRIQRIMGDLNRKGIEVKGVDPLRVTFPALRNGQEVYLCWQEGEHSVDSWRHIHPEPQHRQTLDPARTGVWEWCN